MKAITLEEHFRSKYADGWTTGPFAAFSQTGGELSAKLDDFGDERIADMDKGRIDVQVLSHAVPSPESPRLTKFSQKPTSRSGGSQERSIPIAVL